MAILGKIAPICGKIILFFCKIAVPFCKIGSICGKIALFCPKFAPFFTKNGSIFYKYTPICPTGGRGGLNFFAYSGRI
jgi:hypothetical protein